MLARVLFAAVVASTVSACADRPEDLAEAAQLQARAAVRQELNDPMIGFRPMLTAAEGRRVIVCGELTKQEVERPFRVTFEAGKTDIALLEHWPDSEAAAKWRETCDTAAQRHFNELAQREPGVIKQLINSI